MSIFITKKGDWNFFQSPRKGLSAENIPPTIQNLLIPPATFLDDLEFHVISPPLLA
jgi:hypothetical protein